MIVCSLLLAAPWALLGIILAFALLSLLAVTAQVALNWAAQRRRGPAG